MPSLFEVTAGSLVGPTTGGTVTQASSKATGVTLNTESGQITMNNATLNAGVEVTFAVTNSKVSSTDVVVACHGSGGTAVHILLTQVKSVLVVSKSQFLTYLLET